MEFRRYLKERLSQLRENEALNITETSSDGKGIRKIEFNPQTARSLVSVPYHKQIVFNLNKSMKGLDNFLRLEGYDKNKIEKVHQRLRGSKVSSPRRDREVNPPPGSRVLYNPSVLYFYGFNHDEYLKPVFEGYIFVRGNDNKFYNVFYYDNGWYQNFKYDKSYVIDTDIFKLNIYDGGKSANIQLNVDLLGDNNYRNFEALGLTRASGDSPEWGGINWFCKQLDGPSLDKVYIGNEVSSDVYNNCYKRAISQ